MGISLLLAGGGGAARADTYTYQLIHPLPSGTANASAVRVNDSGMVTWRTIDGSSNTSIQIGDGTSTSTLASGSGSSGVISPWINAGDHVAYRAGGGSGEELRRVGGAGSGVIVGAGATPFSSFGDPSLRDNDDLAFYANKDAGGNGIYVNHAGVNSPIAESGPTYSGFNTEPVINQTGLVAFKAELTAGGAGVFTSDGTTTTTVVTSSSFSNLHGFELNDAATVVYSGIIGGQNRIQTRTGSAAPVNRVTASGTYQNVGNLDINNLDQIAFFAQRLSGAPGIFTGPDPATTRVIQGGDALFGASVNNVSFFTEGLNNEGQVAFYATLSSATPQSGGSTQVIVLATPVPEPLAAPAVAGLLAAGALTRRRRSAARHGSTAITRAGAPLPS